MSDTRSFEQLVLAEVRAEIEKNMAHFDGLPRSLQTCAYLQNVLWAIDISAVALGIFTGVNGIAYFYKLPKAHSRASFAMQEIYVNPRTGFDKYGEWIVASKLMTQMEPAQQEANLEAFRKIEQAHASSALNTLLDIERLNPEARLDEIGEKNLTLAQMIHIVDGVCSRIHPDDIEYYVERESLLPSSRENRQSSPVFSRTEAILDWIHGFHMNIGYTPGPETARKLERALRRQRLPSDNESLFLALNEKLPGNLRKASAENLARIYFNSWATNWIGTEILKAHDKESDQTAEEQKAEIDDLAADLDSLQSALFPAMKDRRGVVARVDREMRTIAAAMRQVHIPESVCRLVEKTWRDDMKRIAVKSFAVAAIGLSAWFGGKDAGHDRRPTVVACSQNVVFNRLDA